MSELNAINAVYVVSCVDTKKIYIGASYNVEKRLMNHRASLRSNKHPIKEMQEDWNKFGESSFKFQILEVAQTPNELYSLEDKYIWGFHELNSNCLYNKALSLKKKKRDEYLQQVMEKNKARDSRT